MMDRWVQPWWVRPARSAMGFLWAVWHPFEWAALVRSRRRRRAAWIAAGRPGVDPTAPVVTLGYAGNLSCSAPGCEWGSGNSYETARAIAIEASRRALERQHRTEKLEAWIGVVLFGLSAALAIVAALAWAGVLR